MQTAIKKLTTNSRLIKEHLTKYRDISTFPIKESIKKYFSGKNKWKTIVIILLIIFFPVSMTTTAPVEVVAKNPSLITAPFNGVIKKIIVNNNDTVESGDLLAVLEDNDLINQYNLAKQTLQVAEKENGVINHEFKVDFEYLKGQQKTYYKVNIEQLHHNKQEKIHKRNQISESFLEPNINQAIFENYPYEIFHNTVNFIVNGKHLERNDFVIKKPTSKVVEYIDNKGKEHKLNFYFYNIKSTLNKVKVFFQTDNAGLKSVSHQYTYSSDWYTSDLGTWFIYIESPLLNTDLFRNLDIESLGEKEVKKIKDTIKETINDFFKARNKRFDKFLKRLENDKYYPYQENEKPASTSQEVLFKKVAYLLEDEHKLIQNDDKIRNFLYPLLDKAISNGNIEYIFNKVLKLSDESLEKFHHLLEKTDLEDVVQFASIVAEKTEFLEFLHELTYGEISKHIKERSQLHKIVEHQLWLFGENYNGTPKLWSDKKIGNIFAFWKWHKSIRFNRRTRV